MELYLYCLLCLRGVHKGNFTLADFSFLGRGVLGPVVNGVSKAPASLQASVTDMRRGTASDPAKSPLRT